MYKTEHDRTLLKTKKQFRITFNHTGTFKHHIFELLVIQQPAVITFDVAKSMVTFDLHYQIANKYGNVM